MDCLRSTTEYFTTDGKCVVMSLVDNLLSSSIEIMRKLKCSRVVFLVNVVYRIIRYNCIVCNLQRNRLILIIIKIIRIKFDCDVRICFVSSMICIYCVITSKVCLKVCRSFCVGCVIISFINITLYDNIDRISIGKTF